jgi:glycosyltransferase involved in cell wall biosynthesis
VRILFLSFYYKPDLCAGSFRNTALAEVLSQKLGANDEIHIVTTIPNRYKTYNHDFEHHERSGNIVIDRIRIPLHQSGFIDQVFSFVRYFVSTLWIIRNKKYDLVYGSSSRLFTAFLAAIASRWKGAPLYLDIRDLFVDTITEVVKNKFASGILRVLLRRIESFTFSTAKHINMVSPGFREYLSMFGVKSYSYYTNGIDEEFLLARNAPEKKASPGTIPTILYAGNIGEGQGLEKIIPVAANKLRGQFSFSIVGDGGTRKKLSDNIEALKLDNVTIRPPVKRKELARLYHEADYLFLHLNDYEAFKKVLPSKIFEYGAFDKPIIAGVGGVARQFIQENISNSILFDPGNAQQLADLLLSTPYVEEPRDAFCQSFSRNAIMDKMADSLVTLAK